MEITGVQWSHLDLMSIWSSPDFYIHEKLIHVTPCNSCNYFRWVSCCKSMGFEFRLVFDLGLGLSFADADYVMNYDSNYLKFVHTIIAFWKLATVPRHSHNSGNVSVNSPSKCLYPRHLSVEISTSGAESRFCFHWGLCHLQPAFTCFTKRHKELKILKQGQ